MPDDDFSDAPVGDTVAPCPYAKPEHWIEIQLEDQDGQPVPNEEFVVVTPDGQRQTGYLDSKGWARMAPLDSGGSCSVSFPNLDKTLWRYDRSEGPA